jgi:hypothetical protein
MLSMIGGNLPADTRRAGPPPVEPSEFAIEAVQVDDTEVKDLTVTLQHAPRISGQLVCDGRRPQPTASELMGLSIAQVPEDGFSTSVVLQDKVGAEGTFTTFGVPSGSYQIGVTGEVSGWVMKSISYAGVDYTRMPMSLGQADIADVKITFSDEPRAVVNGTVFGPQGLPDAAAVVLIFPADRATWPHLRLSSRSLIIVATSTDGVYSANVLAAGDYVAVALPSTVGADWQRERFFASIVALGTPLHLTPGQTLTTDLRTRPSIARGAGTARESN